MLGLVNKCSYGKYIFISKIILPEMNYGVDPSVNYLFPIKYFQNVL